MMKQKIENSVEELEKELKQQKDKEIYKEKDKYVQLTRDLYDHKGLDEENYKELINFSKPINSSRDYITKEKDDYER